MQQTAPSRQQHHRADARRPQLIGARVQHEDAELFRRAATIDERSLSDALRLALSLYIAHVVATRNDSGPKPGKELRAAKTPFEEAPDAAPS